MRVEVAVCHRTPAIGRTTPDGVRQAPARSLGPDLPLPCALDQLVGDSQRLFRPAGERR